MKKVKDKTKNFIFAIVILSIMLVVSVIYNLFGGVSVASKTKAYLEIGDNYTFTLDDLGVKSEAFLVQGSTLTNLPIKQKIQIKLPEIQTKNLILRVKLQFLDKNVTILGFDNWDKNGDYYTYTGELYQNQTIGLCEEIILSDDVNTRSDTLYYFIVSVEYVNEAGLNL